MLSKSVFNMISEVKITLKNPNISWEISNLNGLYTPIFLAQIVANRDKKWHKIDPWMSKKNHK